MTNRIEQHTTTEMLLQNSHNIVTSHSDHLRSGQFKLPYTVNVKYKPDIKDSVLKKKKKKPTQGCLGGSVV